ncbi:hypothetical protein GCM10028857_20800 [Salinarchaeum chitinilyticum]
MTTATKDDRDRAADGLPLVELFGDTARARLVSIFATERSREFTITELAEQTGHTRASVYEHIDDLVALQVAEELQVGKSTRYRTADSPIAEKCYECSGVTLRQLLKIEGKLD